MALPEAILLLSCVGIALVISDPVSRMILKGMGHKPEPDAFGTNLKRGSLGFTVRGVTAIAIGFTLMIVIKSALI